MSTRKSHAADESDGRIGMERLTRRTFVKGVGWLTITSALGAGLAGCTQPQQPEAPAVDADAQPVDTQAPAASKPIADPNEGVTFGHACCNVNCTSHCHLKSHVKDGRIVAVSPGDVPGREDYGNVCLRGLALSQKTCDENARVMFPMKRTGERGIGEFERISWDQAIDEIAERLQATNATPMAPRPAGFYSFTGNSGTLTMSAATRFARHLSAPRTFDIEGIMGDHGGSMGMTHGLRGQSAAAHDTRDYLNSKMIVLWGRNVADTHTSEFRYLVQAREQRCQDRGGRPAVLLRRAPSPTSGSPSRPQTDPALALGMMNVIVSREPACGRLAGGPQQRSVPGVQPDGSVPEVGRGRGREEPGVGRAPPKAPSTFDGEGVARRHYPAPSRWTARQVPHGLRLAHATRCRSTTLDYNLRDHGPRPKMSSRPSPWSTPPPSLPASAWARACSACGTPISPFRAVAALAAVAGYVGVPRRRRVAHGRHGLHADGDPRM